jgi:hypothetical protein
MESGIMPDTGTASEAVTSTIIVGTTTVTAIFAKNTVKYVELTGS